jgi:chromosome segregation ATPase
MWKIIFNFLTNVVTLSQRLEAQEEALENAQVEVKELTASMQRLVYELQRINDELRRLADHEMSEREKFELRVENQLLKANRQLPPPASTEES